MAKVLIVDDLEENRYLLQVLLEGHGYEVELVNEGAAALTAARRNPPDLVISDILMPVMDGFALCRSWVKDDVLREIPFVFYTATYTGLKDEELALSLGASRFIIKPMDPDLFVAAIAEVLEEWGGDEFVKPLTAMENEEVFLQKYNKVLIRKLEDKVQELEADVAARIEAEEALRVSQELLAHTFASLDEAVFLIDPKTRTIQMCNQAAERIFGYSVEELVGRNTAFMYVDEASYEEFGARLFRTLDVADVFKTEYRMQRKDGTTFPSDNTVTQIVDTNGARTAVVSVVRDVTERKRAEEQIHYQASLVANSSDPIIGTDLLYNIRTWNPAAEITYGWKVAEVLNRPMREFIQNDYPVGSLQEILDQIEETGYWKGEVTQNRRDGTRFPVLSSVSLLKDPTGRAIGYVAVNHDITRRKEIEEAEREQRTLAEALRDTASALASTLSFDDVLDRILDEVRRVLPHDTVHIMLTKDGIAEIVRSRGYTDWSHVTPRETVTLPMDITANLHAIEQSGQPLAIPDTQLYPGWNDWPQTRWIRSNVCAPIRIREKVIGFLSLDSATPGFYTQTHAERLQVFADQAAVAMENAQLYEAIRLHADELEQRVQRRTAELTSANEQLRELSKMKSEFVANVSHELRTPLSNITTYLYLLERGKAERRTEYMGTLHRENALLSRLIDDLLLLSRMDLGKVEPVYRSVNVNDLIALLVSDRANMFVDSGLTLDLDIAPELPMVKADERMVIQVLTNLMTNARHYTPSGGAVILGSGYQILDMEASALHLPSPAAEGLSPVLPPTGGRWVTLFVRDTGPGISTEEQAKLFQRFFRGEAAEQSSAPGTGLGLAICREIIVAHGGHLSVDSQVGVGSTFTVWLPVDREEVAEEDHEPKRHSRLY